MSCPIDPASLDKLKTFLNSIKNQPDILYSPQLTFFKEFIEYFGGKIPSPSKMSSDDIKAEPKQEEPEKTAAAEEPGVASDSESDWKDIPGCVEPDTLDESQFMGDPNKEVTHEDKIDGNEKREKAMAYFAEKDYEKALEVYTEAIKINPQCALYFAKRGQVYLSMNRPNACIKDCTRALELNPDSASAYKFRGVAHRLLGHWDLAAKDLWEASTIDFDPETDKWLKEVTPYAKKIEEKLLKQERARKEAEERERVERIRKAREANAAASAKHEAHDDEGAPGGGPPMGDFYKLLQDPEIMTAFQDPEVATAFEDISRNPANISKYQSNPKIMALLSKLSSKFSGMGGMNIPGFPGAAGGFPGFPGAGMFGGADASNPTPPQKPDEDNLD